MYAENQNNSKAIFWRDVQYMYIHILVFWFTVLLLLISGHKAQTTKDFAIISHQSTGEGCARASYAPPPPSLWTCKYVNRKWTIVRRRCADNNGIKSYRTLHMVHIYYHHSSFRLAFSSPQRGACSSSDVSKCEFELWPREQQGTKLHVRLNYQGMTDDCMSMCKSKNFIGRECCSHHFFVSDTMLVPSVFHQQYEQHQQ